jgi:hypothetical protein
VRHEYYYLPPSVHLRYKLKTKRTDPVGTRQERVNAKRKVEEVELGRTNPGQYTVESDYWLYISEGWDDNLGDYDSSDDHVDDDDECKPDCHPSVKAVKI